MEQQPDPPENASDLLDREYNSQTAKEEAWAVSPVSGMLHEVLTCAPCRVRYGKNFQTHRLEHLYSRWRELGYPNPEYPQGMNLLEGWELFLESLGESVEQNGKAVAPPPGRSVDPEMIIEIDPTQTRCQAGVATSVLFG